MFLQHLGLTCNGTLKNELFFMKMVLEPCIKPAPEVHLVLKYPAHGIDVHKELSQGSTVKLYSISKADANLKVMLKRKQNQITASVSLT